MRIPSSLLVGVVLAIASGCGDGGDPTPEEQACLDTADAVAAAAARCGMDYDANREAFIEVAAAGDCGNISQVRDATQLDEVCLPSLETISCDDLTAGNLDPACFGQLQR